MTRPSTSTFVVSLFFLSPSVTSFSVIQTPASSSTTALHMGLFDGVKDAFSAPTLERSKIDAERETPIDRWMGWSVASDTTASQEKARQAGTSLRCRNARRERRRRMFIPLSPSFTPPRPSHHSLYHPQSRNKNSSIPWTPSIT